jgi:hypothetical protein
MNITKILTAIAFAFAVLSSAGLAESCCDKAKAAGKECAHKCCVEATKAGKVCEKCNPPKDVEKK